MLWCVWPAEAAGLDAQAALDSPAREGVLRDRDAALQDGVPGDAYGHMREETFESADRRRTFYLFVPQSADGSGAPLLVLLHGSYSDGAAIAGRWTDLAHHEGFIVAAPNARDRRAWHIRAEGPAFMHALVQAVAVRHPIDACRVYLFGHSGGAVYALTLSMLESEFFAATAVHGGAWRDRREFIAVPYARRGIPIAIFIGDKDQYFPLRAAERTRQVLSDGGHLAVLRVLERHSHDYAPVAAEVNRAAWDFMKSKVLSRGATQEP